MTTIQSSRYLIVLFLGSSCDFARRDFGIAADQIGVDTANQFNKEAVRCERALGTYLIGANYDPIKNASHSDRIIAIFLIRFNRRKAKDKARRLVSMRTCKANALNAETLLNDLLSCAITISTTP